MFTSEADEFRTVQALADLREAGRKRPRDVVGRIVTGFRTGASAKKDAATRLEWFVEGKAPLDALGEDREIRAALMIASALPEDDPEAFLAATALLLAERLAARSGADNLFWSWNAQAAHYRRADDATRAAIMCGFREAARLRRVSLGGTPTDDDCLTVSRDTVLGRLGSDAAAQLPDSLTRDLLLAVRAEVGTRAAGVLWAEWHPVVLDLHGPARAVALSAFRYLYERPVSMIRGMGVDFPEIPATE